MAMRVAWKTVRHVAGALAVAFLAGVVACSKAGETCASDADCGSNQSRVDASSPGDASLLPEGGGCERTIADYCAGASPPAECGGFDAMARASCAQAGPPPVQGSTSCAGIDYLEVRGVDDAFLYFFDGTGALVAVDFYSANFQGSLTCFAGAPPGLTPPDDPMHCTAGACCMAASRPVCPSDGGVVDALAE